MKKYIFKPHDNIRICSFSIIFLILLFPNFIAIIYDITHTTIFPTSIFAMIMIWVDILTLLAYFLAYIIYPTKYVIVDGYLVKTYHREELFKIKTSDIEKIYIKKSKQWYVFFRTIIALGLGDPMLDLDSFLTKISFIFSKSEFVQPEENQDNPTLSLKSPLDLNKQERYETLSLRKCKKICKILKIEPIYINQSRWET